MDSNNKISSNSSPGGNLPWLVVTCVVSTIIRNYILQPILATLWPNHPDAQKFQAMFTASVTPFSEDASFSPTSFVANNLLPVTEDSRERLNKAQFQQLFNESMGWTPERGTLYTLPRENPLPSFDSSSHESPEVTEPYQEPTAVTYPLRSYASYDWTPQPVENDYRPSKLFQQILLNDKKQPGFIGPLPFDTALTALATATDQPPPPPPPGLPPNPTAIPINNKEIFIPVEAATALDNKGGGSYTQTDSEKKVLILILLLALAILKIRKKKTVQNINIDLDEVKGVLNKHNVTVEDKNNILEIAIKQLPNR